MDFFIIIRIMIWVIIVSVTWFFGRLMVLPAVDKIFPNLPPVPVVRGIYTIVLEALKAVFHYILIFLLIMYVIYCIIRAFVPAFILFIPLKQPLLDLTPLYELRVSGIFPLMDRVVEIIFSSMPFTQRIMRALQAIGKFMASSVGYIFGQLNFVKIALNQKLSEMTGRYSSSTQISRSTSTPKKSGTVQSRSQALKQKRDPNSTDPLMDAEGGVEPTFKPNYSKKGNIYVENEYQRCIEKNYKEITPDMSMTNRLQATISNNNTSITCNVQKLKHYSNIKAR